MGLSRTLRTVLAAAAVAAACGSAPASAFELFGIRFFGEDPAPPPPDAVTYTVEFEVAGERALLGRVRAASLLAEGEGEPLPGSAAIIATARRDYQRIVGALYTEAYYGPVVSITIDGEQAATVPLDTDFGDEALVRVTVDPGPRFAFGRVEIDGRAGAMPPDDRTVPRTPEEIGLVPGLPALSTAVVASEAALVGRWRELGHPKAEVARREAIARHERQLLDVSLAVRPGPPAVFGETTVTGTQRMDPVFVAYYAGISPGEPFDPDDIERAREQLRRLGVFSAVRIVEGEELGPDGKLPMEIVVAERKRRAYGFGVKYSTLDGLALDGYWRHRNLFGRAERLTVEGRVGGIDSEDPEDYNYRTAITFEKPGVFNPWTDFRTTLYAEQVRPDTYRARTVGARAGLVYRPFDRLTWESFANVELSTIDRTNVGDGDFVFLSLPNTLAWDGSDSELNPTEGFRLSAHVEPFYEAMNDNAGVITELSASVYVNFGWDRLVLAGRAATGSIAGAPLQEVPASRLFFVGGGGSIRGYDYRGVGPIGPNGNVIGGRSYFAASAEARIGVTERIGVVPFVDFGNAFINEVPDFSEPMRFAAGVGLRYQTGLGPLRFDVAVPIDPRPGDPDFAFYVGLGQAF